MACEYPGILRGSVECGNGGICTQESTYGTAGSGDCGFHSLGNRIGFVAGAQSALDSLDLCSFPLTINVFWRCFHLVWTGI